MLTASEHDTARELNGPEAALPLAAHAPLSSEWGTRPQGVRRDTPGVEESDDLWDDAFASW
jgi:hypothetical protein